MRLLLPARIGLLRVRPPRLTPGKVVKNGTALLLAIGAAITTGGPAHADIAYSPGPKLPALAKSTLDTRYALNRQALLQAANEAEQGGDAMRAHTLNEMADPRRQFRPFD